MSKPFLNPWRFVAAMVIGFSLGFFSGVYVYATVLDQPEVVNQNTVKQRLKVKGGGNSVMQDYEDSRTEKKERSRNGR